MSMNENSVKGSKGGKHNNAGDRDTIQQHMSKYYFQYRIDEVNGFNPKICIGVCREDFLVNQDLSRQKNVWCINLKTGDVFTDRKWREYFDVDGRE